MVDYPVPDDNLDGVTREELTRARIAKHKELLSPEVQAPAAQRRMDENFANIHADLREIHVQLSRVVEILKERKDAEFHAQTGENHARSEAQSGVRQESRDSTESGTGLRRGGQEGRRTER